MKPLPQDLEAERAVVGGVLVDPTLIDTARGEVHPDDFHSPRCRRVYEAVLDLADEGKPIDPVLVKGRLGGDERAASLVGELMQGVPKASNVEFYGQRVRCTAWRRAKHRQLHGAIEASENGATDGELQEILESIADGQPLSMAEHVEAIDVSQVDVEPPSWSVDQFTEQGKLHLWWSAPGVGKSYLMLTLLAHLMNGPGKLWGHDSLTIRRKHHRVLWISGEETAGRVAWRWKRVRAGCDQPSGELLHIWAPGKPRVYLNHLPRLMDEYKPDALVVDPLRVLLPPTWGDKPINWDGDTAAAHDAAATIRGAAADRGADLFLLHHPRKAGDTYGGPVAWEAAVDVMVGLRRKGEVIAVDVEKIREGRKPPRFHLVLQHGDKDVRAMLSTDPAARLSDRGKRAVDLVIGVGGGLKQAELLRLLSAEFGIERPTAYNAVAEALAAGRLRDAGRKIGNSPVLEVPADSALTVDGGKTP